MTPPPPLLTPPLPSLHSSSSSPDSSSSYELCVLFCPGLCVSSPSSAVLWSSCGSSGLLLFSCFLRYLHLQFFTSFLPLFLRASYLHFRPSSLCFRVLVNDLQNS